MKRSRDRSLLAALMGFQQRKAMFNQCLQWRGSAPESASLVRPWYSITGEDPLKLSRGIFRVSRPNRDLSAV